MDTFSPEPNRRSRKIAPVDRTAEEIAAEDLLDLEGERLRSRQLAENESQNITNPDKRLSVSDKNLSEHYHSCIQLAAENKINSKNAFSFRLIDLLHSMFSKKKPINDFTEVSSSLDAGVKIYSCRVDNVHSDTLKMATSVCLGSKTRNEDDDQEQGAMADKKRKILRKTKKTTIAPAKEIDRPKVNDLQNCTYSILTNENFVTSSAIFDGTKVSWHLNTLRNFWQSEKPVPYRSESIAVNFPTVRDDVPISTMFKDFQFGDDKTINESSVQEKRSIDLMSSAFDIDLEPDNALVDDDSVLQNDWDEDICEVPLNSKSKESENHVACLSRMMSSPDFILEMSNLITSEKSDYRYFNFQKLQKRINSRNTQHWAPLRKKSTCEKRAKDEKKEVINFENISEKDDDLKIFEKKSDPACTFSTTNTKDKFLDTQITDFSYNKFFKLNVWRDMLILPDKNNRDESPSELEDMIEDYDYDNPNDSQNFLPEHHEDDYHDEGENEVPADVHEAIEKTMLLRDNLVEIPNKVSKIQLPYMVKDKSVNMKELKSKIWKVIETEKAIIEEFTHEPSTFVSICNRIMFEECVQKDLSVPIVFNAILQLANDKNLAFSSKDESTNFVVSVDAAK